MQADRRRLVRLHTPASGAQRALRDAGYDFDKVIAARGIPFGLFTTGRRPELKKLSGQEKLPVLALPDGSTVNGSGEIYLPGRAPTRLA